MESRTSRPGGQHVDALLKAVGGRQLRPKRGLTLQSHAGKGALQAACGRRVVHVTAWLVRVRVVVHARVVRRAQSVPVRKAVVALHRPPRFKEGLGFEVLGFSSLGVRARFQSATLGDSDVDPQS